MTPPNRAALAVSLALLLGLGSAAGDAGAAGMRTRLYRVRVTEWIPIGSRLTEAVSFTITTPGKVRALYATPAHDARYGIHDWAVGSVWIGGREGHTWDDIFAVDYPIPAGFTRRVARLGLPVTSPMWVNAGDVFTVLWDDDESEPPPWPPTMWVLEVEQ